MTTPTNNSEQPDQPVCQCNAPNMFCSICMAGPRKREYERFLSRRADRLYRGGRGIPRIVTPVPSVSTKKLDKKKFHAVKKMLQQALGRHLTNQQVKDYLEVRAKALREKLEKTGTAETTEPTKPIAEEKIDLAVKKALK